MWMWLILFFARDATICLSLREIVLQADIFFLKLETNGLPEVKCNVRMQAAEIVKPFQLLCHFCYSTVNSAKSSKSKNWKENVLFKSSKCQLSRLGRCCSLWFPTSFQLQPTIHRMTTHLFEVRVDQGAPCTVISRKGTSCCPYLTRYMPSVLFSVPHLWLFDSQPCSMFFL